VTRRDFIGAAIGAPDISHLVHLCRSPVEKMFMQAMVSEWAHDASVSTYGECEYQLNPRFLVILRGGDDLIVAPQHRVGRYTLDFYLPFVGATPGTSARRSRPEPTASAIERCSRRTSSPSASPAPRCGSRRTAALQRRSTWPTLCATSGRSFARMPLTWHAVFRLRSSTLELRRVRLDAPRQGRGPRARLGELHGPDSTVAASER
jgi:hypothetical protein